MSYILDALRKAERDRRQARVPSLGTMHATPEEPRKAWPWIVGGVLALNVVGLMGFVMLRDAPRPAALEAPRPAPERPATVTPPAPGKAAEAVAARGKPLAPVETAVASAKPAVPPPAHSATARPDAPPRETDLKLEVLVYSANPEERAAYINGQRYREGQQVNPRFVIERITADSVVLAGKDARKILTQQ